MGVHVLQSFNMVIDRNREDLGLTRYVAANHQHDAELADGVGKAEYRGRKEAVTGQWDSDRNKSIKWRCAQCGCDLERAASDRTEGIH